MRVTREEYLSYLEDLGCGPPAGSSAADVDVWGRELEDLKNLVTKGIGIRLNVTVVSSSTAEPCVTSQRGEVTGGVRVVEELEEASYSRHFEDIFPRRGPGSTPGFGAVGGPGGVWGGGEVTVSHEASLGADLTVEGARKRELVALGDMDLDFREAHLALR
jgi:hypothetical protein